MTLQKKQIAKKNSNSSLFQGLCISCVQTTYDKGKPRFSMNIKTTQTVKSNINISTKTRPYVTRFKQRKDSSPSIRSLISSICTRSHNYTATHVRFQSERPAKQSFWCKQNSAIQYYFFVWQYWRADFEHTLISFSFDRSFCQPHSQFISAQPQFSSSI